MGIEKVEKGVGKRGLFEKLSEVQKNIVTKRPTLYMLLDKSGSMQDVCDNGKTKVELLKEAVMEVHSRYGGRVFLEYVVFDVEAFRRTLGDVLMVNPSGGTAIYAALDVLLEGPPSTQAILVTDGRCGDPHKTICHIPQLQRKGIVVHTIACGEDADEDLLMLIAIRTGGTFTRVGNPIHLPAEFARISAKAVAALTEGKS